MKTYLLNDKKTKVSDLSLGTWTFSGAKVWGACDETEAIQTVHDALDYGINLVDTAEGYGDGQAELILGKAIRDRRHKVVLASKVLRNKINYDDLILSCENSLKRLQTDYIDIFQIHWPNTDISPEDTFRAFERLKKDGKILNVGVCNHGNGALQLIEQYDIVTNQMPYSLLWRVTEQYFGSVMEEKEIMLWAYSPLAQGLLTGKYKALEDVPIHKRTTRMYDSKWGAGRHTDHGFEEEIFLFLEELFCLCSKSGYSMSSIALNFLKLQKHVGSVLVGARTRKQLEENRIAFETIVPIEIMEQVLQLSDKLKPKLGNNADLWENSYNGKGRLF